MDDSHSTRVLKRLRDKFRPLMPGYSLEVYQDDYDVNRPRMTETCTAYPTLGHRARTHPRKPCTCCC